MSDKEKLNTLNTIFWDYNTNLLPFNKIIEMDLDSVDEYDFKLILNRMLERLNWYELIDILGIKNLKKLLTPEIITRLRSKELKDRYERIRRILHQEPLSISGWDPEYRKRIEATLLSYRWDRT